MTKAPGKKIKTGFLLLLTSLIVSAFSRVYTGAIEQHLSPVALCFYIAFFSNIVFIVLLRNKLKNAFDKILLCRKNIIGINLATAGCWFFLFYPLKYLEPSIVGGLTLCITPLATILIGKFIYPKQNITRYDYIISALTFLMAVYLMTIGFLGETAVGHIPVWADIFSVICCLIVSASLACSNIYAKKLSDAGFSPIEILSVRFVLLTLFSGTLTWFISSGRMLDTLPTTMMMVIIAVFSVIIIPQILYQSAVRELQPISIAMVLPLMPVITFFIEYDDARLSPGIYTITGIMIILVITICSSIMRYYHEKKSTL